LSRETPKINSIVETASGETGTIIDRNLLTGICKVKINPKNNPEGEDTVKPFPKDNLKVIGFAKIEQKQPQDESAAEMENEKNEKEV
jgi:hypothetical protein